MMYRFIIDTFLYDKKCIDKNRHTENKSIKFNFSYRFIEYLRIMPNFSTMFTLAWELVHLLPSWGIPLCCFSRFLSGACRFSPCFGGCMFSCSFMRAFANFKSKELSFHKSLASAAAASASDA